MTLWLLVCGLGLAQDDWTPPVPNLDAQLYRPPVDTRATLWAESTDAFTNQMPTFRFLTHYTARPFVFVKGEDEPVALVGSIFQSNLAAAWGKGPVRAAIDVPIRWYSTSDISGSDTGLGDMVLDVKGTALERGTDPVGLAGVARVSLPTATGELPLGYDKPTFEIAALVDYDIGDLYVVGNLGFRFAPKVEMENITANDLFVLRLAGSYPLTDEAGISADFAGQTHLQAGLSNKASSPLEGMVGGYYEVAEGWRVRGGLGAGMTPGIGSPVARIVLGLSYHWIDNDLDNDGLSNKIDTCPSEPEDKDQWEDADGCPDPDNDDDKVLDVDDDCPNEPEDVDGYADDDGCAEPDNDNDGILDADDLCPENPEDFDTVRDEDGCPEELQRVYVHVKDPEGQPVGAAVVVVTGMGVDKKGGNDFRIALDPGDYDTAVTAEGFKDGAVTFTVGEESPMDVVVTLEPKAAMGALAIKVVDPEGEPIPTATWALGGGAKNPVDDKQIPLPKGAYEVSVSADGYVPEVVPIEVESNETYALEIVLRPAKVKITREQVDLEEKVYFETAKAIIKPESYPLLDQVAAILVDHPEILKVRIEGHTDSRGDDAYNLKLSDDRAQSVRKYLIGKGVEGERLEAIGYGETRPLDPAETEVAWEKNRRVDIFILERQAEEE